MRIYDQHWLTESIVSEMRRLAKLGVSQGRHADRPYRLERDPRAGGAPMSRLIDHVSESNAWLVVLASVAGSVLAVALHMWRAGL